MTHIYSFLADFFMWWAGTFAGWSTWFDDRVPCEPALIPLELNDILTRMIRNQQVQCRQLQKMQQERLALMDDVEWNGRLH